MSVVSGGRALPPHPVLFPAAVGGPGDVVGGAVGLPGPTASAAAAKEHCISLKVMRLCKPGLQLRMPVTCAEHEILFSAKDLPRELTDTAARMDRLSGAVDSVPRRLNMDEESEKPSGSTSTFIQLADELNSRRQDDGRPPNDSATDTDHSDVPGYCCPEFCPSQESFGLCEDFMLPYSFGLIHVGETFRSFVCLQNFKYYDLKNVSLRTEIQANSSKKVYPIFDTPSIASFGANEYFGYVVEHTLKDPGQHMLVCIVSYVDNDGETRSLRKNFKFEAAVPLEYQFQVFTVSPTVSIVKLELKSVVQFPISLLHCRCTPASGFLVEDFNGPEISPAVCTGCDDWSTIRFDQEEDFEGWVLQNNEIRQFTFKVIARSDVVPVSGVQQVKLGSIEVKWASQMGESGRLHLVDVYRQVSESTHVRVTLVSKPSNVRIESMFPMTFQVQNNRRDRALQLKLSFPSQSDSTLQVVGPSSMMLGSIPIQQSIRFTAYFIALKSGVISMPPIEVLDVDTNQSYLASDLPDCFVQLNNAVLK